MTQDLSPSDRAKYACARRAADFVESGMKVGLGTGSTAAFLVKALGEMVRDEGLLFEAVPTSTRTAELARAEGIVVKTLDEVGLLDLTIDGADEFDAELTLIKGGGGAHLQEKIVATASKRMVVIADVSKDVAVLGKFPLPVEVIPFGLEASRSLIQDVLGALGYSDIEITVRMAGDVPFVSDEGNRILDLHLGQISDATQLSAALNQVPGVVENGLFINIASAVVIGHEDGTAVTRDLLRGTETSENVFAADNLFANIGDAS